MKSAEQTLQEIQAHAQAWKHPFFASRPTLEEALECAYSLHDPAVTTAVHVVLNTVAEKLTGLINHAEAPHA